jgi:hypothetical protein
MLTLSFVFFTVIMGFMILPLGVLFLVDGITDAKFQSDFQFAFLNQYMPYFSYFLSACFIVGYYALIRFFYKEENKYEKGIKL